MVSCTTAPSSSLGLRSAPVRWSISWRHSAYRCASCRWAACWTCFVDPAGYNVAYTAEEIRGTTTTPAGRPPAGRCWPWSSTRPPAATPSSWTGGRSSPGFERNTPAAVDVLRTRGDRLLAVLRRGRGFHPHADRDPRRQRPIRALALLQPAAPALPFDHPDLAAWYGADRALGQLSSTRRARCVSASRVGRC